MKPRRDPMLKDEEMPVLMDARDVIKSAISNMDERVADKILGIKTRDKVRPEEEIQGGRPESNRRKF